MVFAEPSTDRSRLKALLRAYNERPEDRPRILAEVEARFQRTLAILVLDTSGFSRTTRATGIVPFLALLERLLRLVQPLVDDAGGRVLRTEADNVFATFPDVAAAVSCAEAIRRALAIANEALPTAEEMQVSMAVGCGSVLVVEPDDVYGDEMNLTCKLGEDLAQRGEVLLTPAARAALAASSYRFDELAFSISGIELRAYRLAK